MKRYLSAFLILSSSLLFIGGCSSMKQATNGVVVNSSTRIYDAGLEKVVKVTAAAVKDQGLGIDNAHRVNPNQYVMIARLSNEYMSNSSDNPQEDGLKIEITYVTEMKTKVEIVRPPPPPGVSNTYRNDYRSGIFEYIGRNLQ